MPSATELDAIAIKAYKEFFRAHEDLFNTNAVEYWRQAGSYKEDQVRKYIQTNGGYTNGKHSGLKKV